MYNWDMLTAAEKADLARLEMIVERGQAAFQEVALALLEIRDKRLYRAQYRTFDLYARDRWGFVGKHAGRYVDAARVLEFCKAIGLPGPRNFRQANAARKIINAAHQRGTTSDEAAAYLARLKEVLAGGTDPMMPEERPSQRNVETAIRRHVTELKRIADLHPISDKAVALLDHYASTILPWPCRPAACDKK